LWEPAFYFSAASYATVGYGDVVLPQMWRNLGPMESIIGVLMCGLSASFLSAIVSRLVDRETKLSRERANPHGAYIEGETIPTI
jgi:voltage-gated potassium channel